MTKEQRLNLTIEFDKRYSCYSVLETEIYFDETENDLFKKVGESFLEHSKGDYATITYTGYVDDTKILTLEFAKRGTYLDKKGDKHPSFHCVKSSYYGNYPLSTKKSKYCDKELRCINTLGNNYKKYLLEIVGDKINAKYGSIDVAVENCKTVIYDRFMFWVLYYEKLSKGYQDVSNTFKGTVVSCQSDLVKVDGNPTNANEILYKRLYEFSQGVVKDNLVSQIVTVKQCERARKIFEELKTKKTLKGFNTCLEKLMLISPRKRDPFAGDKINQYLAKSVHDFESVIDFEETLLLSMETVATPDKVEKTVVKEKLPSFEQFEIEVFEATQEQKDEVMKYLDYNLQQKVSKIFRVKPKAQEQAFSKYCKENNIDIIRKYWHGSPNGNWFSIVKNSLMITKNAAHGRMFGNGIYFAPSSSKSYGYTSSLGSRWANGKSNIAIMGLYAVAYGKPYYPTGYYTHSYDEDFLRKEKCHSVHATMANVGLRADEVIVYNKDAVVLNYIVEFKN